MTTIKGLLKSKVFWFNALTVGVVILGGDDIKQFIGADTIIKIQAGINILLRFATSTSLLEKGV